MATKTTAPKAKRAAAKRPPASAPAARKATPKKTATKTGDKAVKPIAAKAQALKRSGKRSNSGEVLLAATSRLLSERNSTDISLSEIAEASGLNSALISYHFGNKEGLLLALVRRDAEAALAQLDQLLAMKISPEQKIRLHIRGVINTYAKYPYLNRLMHMLLESTHHELSKSISDFFIEPLVAAQTKIIDEGVADGVFRKVDPMCFYFTFIGACDIIFYGRASLENAFAIKELTAPIRDNYADFVAEAAVRLLRPD